MSVQTLEQIFDELGSINTSFGTDKNLSHSYGQVYDTLFEPFRNQAINFLEIGFDSGASLLAFSRYFEHARIFGIDIADRMIFGKDIDRIQVHFGDATLLRNVNHFNTEFDIIVEDASHRPDHQIQHFKDFAPLVKMGGVYIVEDVGQLQAIETPIRQKAEELGFSFEVYDLRSVKNRSDDVLIVLRKTTTK